MIVVSKSLGATVANAALSLAVQDVNGMLTDLYAASFQVLDPTGATIKAKTALDMTANHLGLGRYAAAWDASGAAVGQYTVRWFYTLTQTSAEQSFDQEFEIVAKPYACPRPYCTVYDLRAEGVTSQMGDDARAQSWIARASRYVEHFTGQTFAPEYKSVTLNGNEGRAVLLGDVIVALEDIAIDYFTIFGANTVVVPGETLRIFNRHLTQGLTNPDDRRNPKLEFVHGNDIGGINFSEQANSGFLLSQLIFPRGVKNVEVKGLFGFTEPDGSFVGQTPAMIREVCKMFVVRLMPQLIDTEARDGRSDRIIAENTRDQGVQYAAPWLKGGLTGNWEIDSILADFTRVPHFGAA